eukprot:CAMPEP_0171314410 /NCGR_PEP_ID=MMETSP0816-20121228/51770_1 /TAXON_ID=420281 /ORGANISM="Proboscia inermis, Strain CCAP1064/1" /LENGTH=88 /DNA_ID=CAMNT_0011803339 /DNA_START=1 /DNA_END=264 /DNA_ORIENTATION=+
MNQIPNSVPLDHDDDAPPPMPSMPPPMPPGPSPTSHQPHSLYDEPTYDMSAMGGGALNPSLMDPTSNGHDYDYGHDEEVNDDYPVMGM